MIKIEFTLYTVESIEDGPIASFFSKGDAEVLAGKISKATVHSEYYDFSAFESLEEAFKNPLVRLALKEINNEEYLTLMREP